VTRFNRMGQSPYTEFRILPDAIADKISRHQVTVPRGVLVEPTSDLVQTVPEADPQNQPACDEQVLDCADNWAANHPSNTS
jgi:hypothetical protein